MAIREIVAYPDGNSARALPASTQVGDRLIAFFARSGSNTAPTAPTDGTWGVVTGGAATGANNVATRTAHKVAAAGFATTITGANAGGGLIIICFVGDPWNGATPVLNAQTGTGATMTSAAATMTRTDGGAQVLELAMHRDATALDPPDNMTELVEQAGTTSGRVAASITPGGVVSYPADTNIAAAGGTLGWRTHIIEVPNNNPVPAAGSASLGTLTATGAASGGSTPATGSASLGTLTGSAAGTGEASGSATLTLTAQATHAGGAAGSATLTLTGTAGPAGGAAGSASVTLTAQATAAAPAAGTASLTLAATGNIGAAPVPAAGTVQLTLTATLAATAAPAGSVDLSLTATVTGAASPAGVAALLLAALAGLGGQSAGTATLTLTATGTAAGHAIIGPLEVPPAARIAVVAVLTRLARFAGDQPRTAAPAAPVRHVPVGR